ncbi:MAG: thermonuclease family protein [Anaerolineae bacterium]
MKRSGIGVLLVVLLTACGLFSTPSPSPTPYLKATEDAIRAQVIATATAEAPVPGATFTVAAAPATDTATPEPLLTDTPVPAPTDTPTAAPEVAPTDTPAAPATPTALPASPTPTTYTLQPGDNLSGIAAKFGVTVEALAAYNDIHDPGKIFVGQVLEIPPADYVPPAPEPTATLALVAAQVVEVVDGDTIKVSIGGVIYTVRYIGMDTPETKHPNKPIEWMGPEAASANEALVGGQTVYLEKDVSETDQYGRLLRYVWLTDGRMVNEELVRQGYAQVSTYPPDVRYVDRFLRAQREAREAGRGLWEPEPTAIVEVAATPTPTQAPEPTATQPPVAGGRPNVQIVRIFYDGVVPRVESDEYVEIANLGDAAQDMAGWRINAGDPGQDFAFPEGFVLGPGQSCRLYTNEIHGDSCAGGTFGSGRAIWNNKGDCGYLYDAGGQIVSERCY